MCGFVTILAPKEKPVDAEVLRRMTRSLAHRGPDDAGYAWVDPRDGTSKAWNDATIINGAFDGVLMGHRRLSILDLTAAGHQPMFGDDGTTVVAYNGEIFNYIEIRRELEADGVAFHTRCDTEVLIKAYERWGVGAFPKFNGMWAFALWDGRARRLVACRDRFGVKPLYYAEVGGAWLFASEIKAIQRFPGARRGVDASAAAGYLAYYLRDSREETLYEGVRALPPGSYMELEAGGARPSIQRFWNLPVEPGLGHRPESELVEHFRWLLDDSVRLRGRSDVPIGTMLSGGLDSTAITALISERRRAGSAEGGAACEAFHTFSACWPGWPGDEEADIDLICGRYGLISHKVYPTGEALGALLPEMAYYLEEPFENPTAVLQLMLMREARSRGVKVVLNGHGSDESLAGYSGFYIPTFLAGLLLSRDPRAYLRERRAFRAYGDWSEGRILHEVVNGLLPPSWSEVAQERYRERKFQGLDDLRPGLAPPARNGSAPAGLSQLNRRLWKNFSETILPMWLRMEDRVSMACSVESRLPFMDYRLIEFAFNLPDTYKLKDGYTKWILRRAVGDLLPERIAWARVKRRFATPYQPWFRGPWRPLIEDAFAGHCQVESFLDLPRFRGRLRAYMAGDDSAMADSVLWRTLMMELCLRASREVSTPARAA